MRNPVRIGGIVLLVLFCLAPRSGLATASAGKQTPRQPTLTAIAVPGVSPLATLVFQSGARAILVGHRHSDGRVVVVAYDLTTKRLLRQSLGPTSLSAADSAFQVLDEQRGRAYLLFPISEVRQEKLLTLLCVVDLRRDQISALHAVSGAVTWPPPALDERTGMLWYVALDKTGSFLVHTGPVGAAAGVRRAFLGEQIEGNNLFLDPMRRRLVLVSGSSGTSYAGYDLATARMLWHVTSQALLTPESGPVFDAATGMVWYGDIVHSTVTRISVVDGQEHQLALGGGDVALIQVFTVPGHGVYATLSSAIGTTLVQLVAQPSGHRTVATIPRARLQQVVAQLNGPPGLHLTTDTLVAAFAHGTVLQYAITIKVQDFDAVTVPGSILSVLDWRAGRIVSQQRVPVSGALVSRLSGALPGGFYLTFGTGKHDLATLMWDGAALLVVSTH